MSGWGYIWEKFVSLLLLLRLPLLAIVGCASLSPISSLTGMGLSLSSVSTDLLSTPFSTARLLPPFSIIRLCFSIMKVEGLLLAVVEGLYGFLYVELRSLGVLLWCLMEGVLRSMLLVEVFMLCTEPFLRCMGIESVRLSLHQCI